ncbi:hypothetical protein BJV82DRAFT_632347 [Fennellomyces sp. T-0311]|nr:hypothetical protein BJV82DRAFT_632347 [Fennellomyces sp. T-0311]
MPNWIHGSPCAVAMIIYVYILCLDGLQYIVEKVTKRKLTCSAWSCWLRSESGVS